MLGTNTKSFLIDALFLEHWVLWIAVAGAFFGISIARLLTSFKFYTRYSRSSHSLTCALLWMSAAVALFLIGSWGSFKVGFPWSQSEAREIVTILGIGALSGLLASLIGIVKSKIKYIVLSILILIILVPVLILHIALVDWRALSKESVGLTLQFFHVGQGGASLLLTSPDTEIYLQTDTPDIVVHMRMLEFPLPYGILGISRKYFKIESVGSYKLDELNPDIRFWDSVLMKIPWTRKDEVFLSIVDPELFILYSLIVGPQGQYFRRESEKAVAPY
ncbi:MAG TPA: hypothetical protein PLG79_00410 [Spirochaetales bacterium]|nr:hypothetical protein [Spirochaetales bacterium]